MRREKMRDTGVSIGYDGAARLCLKYVRKCDGAKAESHPKVGTPPYEA